MVEPTTSRRVRLQTLLAALVLTSILPLTVFAVAQLYNSSNRQRAQVDRQHTETARAISVAVDQEVENSITTLEALAALDIFDVPQPSAAAFLELCRRVVPRQPNWHGVVLAEPSGGTLVSSMAISQSGIAALPSRGWVQTVARSRRPGVSNLFEKPGLDEHFVMVAAPVVRSDAVRFVLSVQLRVDGLSDVLHKQQVPLNGVVTLIDANKRIIARTRGGAAMVGRLPSAGFQSAVDRMAEGSWHETLLEGTMAYAAMSRSALTGWTVGIGLPAEQIESPIRQSVLASAGLGLAMLILTGGSALWLARYLVSALSAAAQSSMALARGHAITPLRSRIVEVDALSSGLDLAANTVAARVASEETARRDAETADRLKDEFLMTVSHELRTPLTAIQGWAAMLSSGQIRDERRAHAAEVIARNADALTRLVDDLLDVSRATTGKMRLELAPLDVTSVVQAAVQTVQPAALAKDIRLRTSVEGGNTTVAGDRNRLQQVVWNLVSNAVKFTPAGGAIAVAVRALANAVEIAVADTGPGVDPEFLPFMFDRFRQGTATSTREHRGLGLGLSITRHLVELHGGTIRAENNDGGRGATIRVVLPAAALAEGRVPAQLKRPAADDVYPVSRLDGVSVLIVEGDPQARERFADALEGAGAEVRSTASAGDALAVLQSWRPAVLVSGLEVADAGALAGIHLRLREPLTSEALLAAVATLVARS